MLPHLYIRKIALQANYQTIQQFANSMGVFYLDRIGDYKKLNYINTILKKEIPGIKQQCPTNYMLLANMHNYRLACVWQDTQRLCSPIAIVCKKHAGMLKNDFKNHISRDLLKSISNESIIKRAIFHEAMEVRFFRYIQKNRNSKYYSWIKKDPIQTNTCAHLIAVLQERVFSYYYPERNFYLFNSEIRKGHFETVLKEIEHYSAIYDYIKYCEEYYKVPINGE